MNLRIHNIRKPYNYFSIPILGLVVLTVSYDLFISLKNDSSFYLSESLLFNSFWTLFLPLIILTNHLNRLYSFLHYGLITVIVTLLHALLFSSIVFAVSGIFMYHTFDFLWTLTDCLNDHWITCLLVYGTFLLVKPKHRVNDKSLNQTSKIQINHLNRIILIPTSEILYIKAERPYIAVITNKQSYLHTDTLNGFLKQNPAGEFIQIHKSTIINIGFVRSFTSRKNGDYDVEMFNGDVVRASRNYNHHFRKHIRPQDSL